MDITRHQKFEKEFKKLSKKYTSLQTDLEILLKLIKENPIENGTSSSAIIKKSDSFFIMKKRMMCRAVKGTQFRIIYSYDNKSIELEFIEIYFKGNKSTEDKKRIEQIWQEKFK